VRREVASVPSAEPLPDQHRNDPERLDGWRSTLLGGVVRTARPKQWLKNLLVFAAPGAAGVLTHGADLINALGAFAIFCLVASGVYFLNDTIDTESDRRHPTKRLRPVAAGIVSIRQAQVIGLGLVMVGLASSPAISWKFTVIVGIYVAVQLVYTWRLKHEPILDLAAIASGFVLRAIGGAVAVGVPISEWFLIVATFGSLFMVTGKRMTEHSALGERRAAARPSLGSYSLAFLRSVLMISASVTLTAYCLWAFENAKAVVHGHHAIWFQLSIVPFTLAFLRYGLLIDRGHGGAPEDVVLADRQLQVLALVWAGVFAAGVYL